MTPFATAFDARSRHWTLYLRIFLAAGISFGACVGLFAGLMVVPSLGWERGLSLTGVIGSASGLLFGAAMALILGTVAIVATRDQGAGALAVHQRREIEVCGPREDVVRALTAALQALRGNGPIEVEASGAVVTRTRWSWQSFGEVVRARIDSVSEHRHVVHVESRPSRRLTLVDYGANASNADAVVAALRLKQ